MDTTGPGPHQPTSFRTLQQYRLVVTADAKGNRCRVCPQIMHQAHDVTPDRRTMGRSGSHACLTCAV